jgi:hypothetical protein
MHQNGINGSALVGCESSNEGKISRCRSKSHVDDFNFSACLGNKLFDVMQGSSRKHQLVVMLLAAEDESRNVYCWKTKSLFFIKERIGNCPEGLK